MLDDDYDDIDAKREEPETRGLFGAKGDSLSWLNATQHFPNGVPRFESKQACLDFVNQYLQSHHGGSNPKYPHLQHIFTTLIGWEQIQDVLLPAIDKARKEHSNASRVPKDYGEASIETTTETDNMNRNANTNSTDVSDGAANDAKRRENDAATICTSTGNNVYEQADAAPVVSAIAERLNVSFHKCTTPASTINTLKYLYHHMKFGIFVMIRNKQLRIFAPFVNIHYTNTWADHLRIEGDGTLDTYYSQKAGLYREEQIEPDRSKWWANGNIICNERTRSANATDDMQLLQTSQHWGDHFLAPLRDMLGEACRERDLPDCEFFLNKRDYPQLKVNMQRDKGGLPVEPYGFIFDKDDRDPDQDVDLPEQHKFTSYAPIVSFYAAAPDRFTDVPWPSSEDWEAACGLVFPNTFIHTKQFNPVTGRPEIELNGSPRDLFTEANFIKFRRGWNDGRVATAFFRGTATGGGTTIDNNQRLKVAYLSHLWKNDTIKGGKEPFLDAAIVGWNLRDKKTAQGPMTFLRSDQFDFTAGREHFTPIYEQSKYKYLVYVDGHCAACRYGFMMRLGSVILKVEPRQVADRMWYFPLLKPYHDHVPVKADLSDLEEKIRWCREHDEECQEIAKNAGIFYEKYVGRNALLDYVEMACKHIAKRFVEPPFWWNNVAADIPPPHLRKPDVPCYEDRQTGESRLCTRCQEDYDDEVQELERLENEQENEKVDRAETKKRLRDRMKKRAKPSS
ncbi:hypothetical protein MPSEU_000879800 [Mayamaea pseudoterrestris]|nr:hypothetical protein MPSEU_000879800 [Mayamaea pseudoterrestris]